MLLFFDDLNGPVVFFESNMLPNVVSDDCYSENKFYFPFTGMYLLSSFGLRFSLALLIVSYHCGVDKRHTIED